MLPIVRYPSFVEGFLPRLNGVFTKPQLKHFARYLTGLVVCENKTVTGINRSFMGRNDQSALNHWLTDSRWSEEKLDRARKAAILDFLQARRLKRGVLVVDDTISHKTGKHMEGVDIHYDHSEGRCVLGHQLVTSDLVIGGLSLPLDFELYRRDEGQPDFKTKQELFRILVRRAAEDEVPFTCVVTDTWYFNRRNMKCVEELGRDWVAGCRSNRLILMPGGWTSTSAYIERVPRSRFREVKIETEKGERRFWTYAKNVTMKGRWRVRIVVSYENPELKGEPKILATNRLDWDVKTIIKTYLKRWRVDSSYRDAKQMLGLEDYELRKLRGIRRHWLMVFLAHDLLQLSTRNGGPIGWMKAGLASVGSRCRYAAMEVLKSFIELVVNLARKIRNPEEILKLTTSDLKGLKPYTRWR
jgi:SRSO17 transposase